MASTTKSLGSAVWSLCDSLVYGFIVVLWHGWTASVLMEWFFHPVRVTTCCGAVLLLRVLVPVAVCYENRMKAILAPFIILAFGLLFHILSGYVP